MASCDKATSGSRAGPSTRRSCKDCEVFAPNQITFDEFREAVMLGRLCDVENPHFPRTSRMPNDPKEGQMPMWLALINCYSPLDHLGASTRANAPVPSNAPIVALSTAPSTHVPRPSRQHENCESSTAGQKKKKNARIEATYPVQVDVSKDLDPSSQGRKTGSTSRGAVVVAAEWQHEEVPHLRSLYMPPPDWTVMEDSSIEDLRVPSLLLEFIYLPKDKQRKRDLLGMPCPEAVDVAWLDF
ncbi:hypothetical protein CRG98_011747 [Punica granatum]|uniref:Uncharacterized protein n=1 Tax=Punica granatum TaxID=22663 RepID=A0A2I0KH75_PUNGR|nr:hypothetical protein CRG98_011747 [Punica granatum]